MTFIDSSLPTAGVLETLLRDGAISAVEIRYSSGRRQISHRCDDGTFEVEVLDESQSLLNAGSMSVDELQQDLARELDDLSGERVELRIVVETVVKQSREQAEPRCGRQPADKRHAR
jgi:hypothetical protein